MKVITANLLNRFWTNGIKPLKEKLDSFADGFNIANNCTTTLPGWALDARQGKELKDEITEISSDLENKLSSATDEHAVGTWIDGKTIYAKTITVNITKAGNVSVAHGITGIGTFRAVDYSRSFFIRTDGQYCPIPQVSTVEGQDHYAATVSFINETSIVIQAGSYAFGKYTVTINYTKI